MRKIFFDLLLKHGSEAGCDIASKDLQSRIEELVSIQHIFTVISSYDKLEKLLNLNLVKSSEINDILIKEKLYDQNRYSFEVLVEPKLIYTSEIKYFEEEFNIILSSFGEPRFFLLSDFANDSIDDFEKISLGNDLSKLKSRFVDIFLNSELRSIYDIEMSRLSLESSLCNNPQKKKKTKL